VFYYTHTVREGQASEGVGKASVRECERENIDQGGTAGGRREGGSRWNPSQSLMFWVFRPNRAWVFRPKRVWVFRPKRVWEFRPKRVWVF
jgi:hypothetical protein